MYLVSIWHIFGRLWAPFGTFGSHLGDFGRHLGTWMYQSGPKVAQSNPIDAQTDLARLGPNPFGPNKRFRDDNSLLPYSRCRHDAVSLVPRICTGGWEDQICER